MLFLVALFYLVSSISACGIDQLSQCITEAIIPGKPSICDCWTQFVPSLPDCDDTQTTTLMSLIPSIKVACPNVDIGITPTDCMSSNSAYLFCIATASLASKSACDCYTQYKTNSDQFCVKPEEKLLTYPLCLQAKVLCNTITCEVDCSLFETDLKVRAETEFESCISNSTTETEHCNCFTTSHDMVGSFTSACQGAADVSITSCIKAQLDCSSLLTSENCTATEGEVKIEDISSLFDDDVNKEKFISNWNTKFSDDGKSISVTGCTHSTMGEDIVFTITVNYDDAKETIQQVVDDLKKVFSITIGLPESKLSGHADSPKRSVSAPTTATVTMTGTGSTGGGVSALSFVIIPVLVITGTFHYFF